jgi:membrane protein
MSAKPVLSGHGAWAVTKETAKEYVQDDLLTYASALAFQGLLSLFPFVLFLISLLGFLQLDSFFAWLQRTATALVPADAAGLVNQIVDELQQQQRGLLSFGAVLALWAASTGVRRMMTAMNVAYDVPEARAPLKRYSLSILYTLGLAAMLILAAVLLVLGPQAMEWIASQVGLHDAFVTVWTWLRWPVAAALLTLAVAVIYYAAPNVDHPFKLVTPGALVAVGVWLAASVGFGYYVSNFADYDKTYGSIGAVIILLLYFYISAAVLLFGAEMNAIIERGSTGIRPAETPAKSSSSERSERDRAPRLTTGRSVSGR